MTTLDLRTLNRTLLTRQRLLDRVDEPVSATIEHLVGLQAQNPHDPYITLWTRLRDFEPHVLSRSLERRRTVRATLMRSTIHLVTARDCLALRPLVQDRLVRTFYGQQWRHAVAHLDPEAIIAAGTEILETGPHTTKEVRDAMARRFPGAPADALAMMVKYIVPSVQTPPRGMWGQTAHPAWTTIGHWLGKPLSEPRPDRLFLRYLTAFGPATVADFRNWSGLSGFTDVVAALRPNLRTYRGPDGRELLDVMDAPITDGGAPAPPRFFADYDNVFLGHQDRSRITAMPTFRDNVIGTSSFAVDGFLAGTWKLAKRTRSATLSIEPWGKLTKAQRDEVAHEAAALMDLLIPQITERDLRFV